MSKQHKLPLPEPRSPQELDERILSAARQRAPKRRSQQQPWWLAGAATVSVLLVAVLLTNNTTQVATPKAKFKPVPSAAMAPEAARESMMQAEMDSASDFSSNQAAGAISRSSTVHSEAMSEEQPPGLKAMSKAQRSAGYSLAADEGMDPTSELTLTADIQRLSALLQQGQTESARSQYEQLRKNCPRCALPDSLEEAIALYPEVPAGEEK
ncbi:MAG: hypothetical protein V7754_13630 [Halioglobus sp.]